MGYAVWFYGGDDFSSLQCVYPDLNNHLPWTKPSMSNGVIGSHCYFHIPCLRGLSKTSGLWTTQPAVCTIGNSPTSRTPESLQQSA